MAFDSATSAEVQFINSLGNWVPETRKTVEAKINLLVLYMRAMQRRTDLAGISPEAVEQACCDRMRSLRMQLRR